MHWSGFSFTVFTFVLYRALFLHQLEIIHIISHAGNEKDGRRVIRAPRFGPATHIVAKQEVMCCCGGEEHVEGGESSFSMSDFHKVSASMLHSAFAG